MRTAGSSSDVPARRRIIGVGRLTEQKQFDHLIEAFAKVARRDPNLDLWIWGEGPLRNALRKQAMDAGLSERVFLPGKTGEPWAEMARAELLVMTSAYEGFPNALLEAMALGVPCISYDCPSGPREITDDGRLAVLVPLGDRDALVRAISSSLERPAERRASAQAAAKVVRERFSLPAVLRKWDTLFESVRRGIYVRSDNGPACDAKHH
jgi:glycosyltransferase involved in cell wall biosynthesis